MTGVQVTVTGTAEVSSRFAILAHRVGDLHRPLDVTANRVAAEARALAPKVTGRLAGSIRPSSTRLGSGATTSLVYAAPINYGWRRRNIAPSLFMNRAADDKGAVTAVLIAAELTRLIKSAGLG
jgi:hypothetical protein